MKPIFTCLLTIFNLYIGCSQSYLNKRFDFDTHPNSLFSSVLYSDDTLYVVGVITDSVSPFRPKMLLAKIDLYGELLYYNVYNPVPNYFYGVYSNNLTKVGSGFIASEYTFTNEGLKSALYLMNDSFKVSEVVEITPPQSIGFNTFRDILVTNNAIYAIGETQINDTLAFNNLDIDIQLVKFDTQGNFIWRNSYGIWYKQEMAYSLCANGNNIIINGNKNDDALNIQLPKYYQNWLLEIDTNGTVLNEYLDPDSLTWGTMSIITVDDGYILSGRYIDTPQVSPYLTLYSLGYIAKFDFEFNKVWERKFSSAIPNPINQFNTVRQVSDTHFVACGGNAGGGIHKGWVLKFDINGDTSWLRNYYILDTQSEENMFKDIEPLPNGWLAAVGSAYSNYNADNLPEQGWLVIMDSAGCLTPGCQFVGTQDAATGAVQLARVWPNPVSDFVYVTLAGQLFGGSAAVRVSVTDMSGRQVAAFEAKGEGQYMLPTHDWPSGSYVVSVWAGSELHSEVVVKQ